MQHIKEHDRLQMELCSLDTYITGNNPVRVTDAFVHNCIGSFEFFSYCFNQ